jgi:hypothetical protein
MKKTLFFFLCLLPLSGESISKEIAQKLKVKITKDIPYIETMEEGQKIWIMRTQDPTYRLTDDYTKTSRQCPPFCIQPNKVHNKITNIGELELLNFMKNDVMNNTGLVIDARLSSWFKVETIPSAINLPFNIVEKADKAFIAKVFQVFGMKITAAGVWDFSNTKKLAIFCNGVWCEQSKHLIDGLLKYGYPKNRILYYRSGFQGWKLLGLTTVIMEKKEVK